MANINSGMFWKPLVMHVYNTNIQVLPQAVVWGWVGEENALGLIIASH